MFLKKKKNELLSSNNSFQKLPLTSNHLQLCQRNVLFNRKGGKGGHLSNSFLSLWKKAPFSSALCRCTVDMDLCVCVCLCVCASTPWIPVRWASAKLYLHVGQILTFPLISPHFLSFSYAEHRSAHLFSAFFSLLVFYFCTTNVNRLLNTGLYLGTPVTSLVFHWKATYCILLSTFSSATDVQKAKSD